MKPNKGALFKYKTWMNFGFSIDLFFHWALPHDELSFHKLKAHNKTLHNNEDPADADVIAIPRLFLYHKYKSFLIYNSFKYFTSLVLRIYQGLKWKNITCLIGSLEIKETSLA